MEQKGEQSPKHNLLPLNYAAMLDGFCMGSVFCDI